MAAPAEEDEEEEAVAPETIEELQAAIEGLSTTLSETRGQMTLLTSEVAALTGRLNSSLNIAYGIAIVALIAALVAAYYAMKS